MSISRLVAASITLARTFTGLTPSCCLFVGQLEQSLVSFEAYSNFNSPGLVWDSRCRLTVLQCNKLVHYSEEESR